MKKPHMMTVKLFIVVSFFALSAIYGCSGSVQSHVFYDQNANGLLDEGEVSVSNAKLTVIYNGKSIKSGSTNLEGKFSTHSDGSGQYCVDTDLSTVRDTLGQTGLRSIALSVGSHKATNLLPGYGDRTLPEPTNGADPATGGTRTGQTRQTNHGQTQETDTTPTVDPNLPNRICQNVTQSTTANVDFSIPVTINYGAAFEDVMRTRRTCYAGETFTVSIPLPQGHKLKPLHLPDMISLAVSQTGITLNTSLNTLTFEDRTPTGVSTTPRALDLSLSAYRTSEKMLSLRVSNDLPVGASEDVELSPVATGPAGDVPLPVIPLLLVNRPRLSVTLNSISQLGRIETANPPDRPYEISAVVENSGRTPVANARLAIDMPVGVSVTTITTQGGVAAANCQNLGENAQCIIPLLVPGEIVTYNLRFNITPVAAANETRTIEASAVIADEAATSESGNLTFTASPIEFSVRSPVPATPPASGGS